MFEAEQDPYCYPGTSVLINRLDIRDQAALEAFEADVTAERSSQAVPLGSLDDAHYLAIHQHLFQELNAIHPFREGNGRTQLSFLTLLAEQAGHPLAMERLNPEEMMQAMIESFSGDEQPLAAAIQRMMP